MTAKEMQKRNEKAQQLRVFAVEEGTYFVESGDGKVAYKVVTTGDKEYCSCLDYQRHGQSDPHFRCKHLLAIENSLPEGRVEHQGFLKKRQAKLDERFVKNIEGKDFVLYAGLLDLAHQKGLSLLEVEILQYPTKENGHLAICKAMAESKVGETYTDIGDADPTNCNAKVAKHLLRMASTRAKARCLRDYTNIGMTCLEELGDLNEVLGEAPKPGRKAKVEAPREPAPTPPVIPAPAPESRPPAKMSEAQKRALYNLSRRRGIALEDLQQRAQEAYGTALEYLSASDASHFIRQLQAA